MNALIVFFSSKFQYIIVASLIAWIFFDRRKEVRRMIFGALAAALVSRMVLTEIIRHLWYRPRPFVHYGFAPLIPHESSASFPSGHAAFFFAIAWFVLLQKPKASTLFFVAAILIGAARVLAGVHYPTDILAGAAVGLLGAGIVRQLTIRLFPSLLKFWRARVRTSE